MATRAAIARPNGQPGTFVGRYHHWDGYPTALGATLFTIHRTVFDGDTERMLTTLLDEHPAGWSTINGADWSLEPGYAEGYVCARCGEPDWKHWIQNYASRGLPTPEPHTPGTYQALDHNPTRDYDAPKRPECYCHGDRAESEWLVDESNASGSGVEWVYVIDPEARTLQVLASFIASGAKMVGFFGFGDPDATWQVVATVALDGDEPDWAAIGRAPYADEEEEEDAV